MPPATVRQDSFHALPYHRGVIEARPTSIKDMRQERHEIFGANQELRGAIELFEVLAAFHADSAVKSVGQAILRRTR